MSFNLSRAAKVTRVSAAVAAGTGTTNCTAVDMKGYKSVVFVALFGSITASAVTTLKAQSGAASNMSDAADLEGTAISIADDDDDQVAILEIDSPKERYLRPVIVRATANAEIDGVLAFQFNATDEPVTHDSTTVVSSEYHLAPAEGTA